MDNLVQYKICSKCKEKKGLQEFYPIKNGKRIGKYSCACKLCEKKRYKKLPIISCIPNGYKRCTKCQEIKLVSEFYTRKSGISAGKLYSKCKYCSSLYRKTDKFKKAKLANIEKYREQQRNSYSKNKEYYTNKAKERYWSNPEFYRAKQKLYSKNNREKISNYNKKRKLNPLYNCKEKIRCTIKAAIKRMGYTKKSKTQQILGCSYKEFKQYIESKFKPNMNWDNRSKWHLDHIVPISSAKNEGEIIKLNHYTNFQPLWAKENIAKGNKLNWINTYEPIYS